MRIKDIFLLSLFNVRRAGSRALLTALSICVGVSSVVLISALGDSGEAVVSGEIEKLGINGITIYAKNENVSITDNYISEVSKNLPMAIDVQPLVIESGGYYMKKRSGNAIIWGVDGNVNNVISLELLHGRLPNKFDVSQKNRVAVVDSDMAISIYNRSNIVGKTITIKISEVSEKFTIIGVVASQKDGLNQMVGGVIPHFIYIPYGTLCELRGDNTISQIAIKCHDTENNEDAGNLAVETLSRVSGVKNSFGYENIGTHISRFQNISSLITILISAIAAISLIVAGLGIMNTMLAATNERKKEIGILMAIGARNCDISMCFMTESALISFLGSISGTIIGVILSLLATKIAGMPPVFNMFKFIIIIIISIMCSVIFSILPAYRASKLNPIDILHE